MVRARFLFLLLVVCASAKVEFGDQSGVAGVVVPGTTVSVPIKPPAPDTVNAVFHRIGGTAEDDKATTATVENNILKIPVPTGMKGGTWYITVSEPTAATAGSTAGNQNAPAAPTVVPGSITVQPDAVILESVQPTTQYRGENKHFTFDLIGENFSTDPQNDTVWIEGRGSAATTTGKDQKACNDKGVPCLWAESPTRLHIVGYEPEQHQVGTMNVRVQVGNAKSEYKPLVLARVSGAAVLVLSAVLTTILFWIVAVVVRGGLKGNKVGTKRLNLFQSFILDPETNSYSLSKFQLFAFSATFIFAYNYVLLSRLLVQWQFALPDVPSTIAGLLGISGGTTVAAAGLTAARGSKGAGLQYPTGADLISSGGVVVPERFQFFVWTIVSCFGFLALLLGQDIAKVNNFPDLPQGLLYVMGISAAGYLGGKAARKPGPIIQNAAVDSTTRLPDSVLIVQGQNLARDGRFFIDGSELPIVPGEKDLTEAKPQLDGDSNFATELKITVKKDKVDISTGEHRFRIVNRDGQFADVVFTANPPVIDAVGPEGAALADPKARVLTASKTLTRVTIKGNGLMPGSTVDWKQPAADSSVAAEVNSSSADGKTLTVSLVPGPPGMGVLNVTTPSGFVAGATVEVRDTLPSGGGGGQGAGAGTGAGGGGGASGTAAGAGDAEPAAVPTAAPAPGPEGEGPGGTKAPAAGPGSDQ